MAYIGLIETVLSLLLPPVLSVFVQQVGRCRLDVRHQPLLPRSS